MVPKVFEETLVCLDYYLDHAGSMVRLGAYYGQGTGPVIGFIGCHGDESAVSDCYYHHFESYSFSCRGQQDVGVDCQGED